MKQVFRLDIKLLLIQSLNIPIFQVALDKKGKFMKCNVTKDKSLNFNLVWYTCIQYTQN